MEHRCGVRFFVFLPVPRCAQNCGNSSKKIKKIYSKIVIFKNSPLKRRNSSTSSGIPTFLTDTSTQRHQHKRCTTAEKLCLNLHSFWWGLMDSCQDAVPIVASFDVSKNTAKTSVPNLWCLSTGTTQGTTQCLYPG